MNPVIPTLNDLPEAGITLNDPLGTLYVFSPTSQHSNTLIVNVTNPTMANIENGPNARIVITFSTSDAGDPNALTSAALAQKILPKISAFDDNWTYDHEQQGTSHTLVLKPQGPTIVGYGDHALMSIALSDLVTYLPDGMVPLHVAVRDFPGLDDAQSTLVLHRSAYPAPQAQLWPVHPGINQPGQPLLIGWSVEFADALTLTFDDGCTAPTSYLLAKGEIALSDALFTMLNETFLSGTLTLIASNDCHPEVARTIVQDVSVAPVTEVTLRVRASRSSGSVASSGEVTPSPIVASLTCVQNLAQGCHVEVEFLNGWLPNITLDLMVTDNADGSTTFDIVLPTYETKVTMYTSTCQQSGSFTPPGSSGGPMNWTVDIERSGSDFTFVFDLTWPLRWPLS